jgi:hypothetical protein
MWRVSSEFIPAQTRFPALPSSCGRAEDLEDFGMDEPSWILEKVPLMGGATGEAFVNTLQGTGMTAAAVLAREAIQNSADAWKPNLADKVEVRFRRISLTGAKKDNFLRALDLKKQFVSRQKLLGFQQGHCLEVNKKSDAPLHLLYIEDFGTHGLFGNPHDGTSHFFRLLLSLGDGSKARETGSGGSYGYGKSVYSANSRIHTIVAYSAFDPKLDDSKHYGRLMGCAYLHAHRYQGSAYSGRAWFGRPAAGKTDVVDPLEDEEAHEYAKLLGFTVRDKNTRGTSILIVDCGVDCDELRSSIEEWWWPRLLDESVGLDIQLFEESKPLQPPRPRSRTDLKPFIHCFEMAIGRSMPAGKQDKNGNLNKWNGDVTPGSFGYTILDEKDLNDESLQQKSGHIALIRSLRMVVSYMPVSGAFPLPCVGAFVASTEADKPLKISEPPSHDKWDPNSVRLLELSEDDRPLVKLIIDRLRQGLRKFSNEAAPPAPQKDLRLKSLERLLGNLFKTPGGGGGGGGGRADPIEINFVEQPHAVADGNGVRTSGSFRLSLADDAEKDRAKLMLNVECLVVEDSGVSREDPVPVRVKTSDVKYKEDKEKSGALVFTLEEDSSPEFSFSTDSYPADWTTRVRVIVKESN